MGEVDTFLFVIQRCDCSYRELQDIVGVYRGVVFRVVGRGDAWEQCGRGGKVCRWYGCVERYREYGGVQKTCRRDWRLILKVAWSLKKKVVVLDSQQLIIVVKIVNDFSFQKRLEDSRVFFRYFFIVYFGSIVFNGGEGRAYGQRGRGRV